jgi:hypothetical protein
MSSNGKIKNFFRKIGLVPESPQAELEETVRRIATSGLRVRKSKYYTQRHGEFANVKDFDTDRRIEGFLAKFPTLSKDEVRGVVMQGILLWYLR